MADPRAIIATTLAAVGGDEWETAGGALVSRERGRTVLAYAAVSHAVAAARRAAQSGAAVGLAVGELWTTGDSWAGPAVDVAAALADRAHREQVLATATVPGLVPRGADQWTPVGPRDVGVAGTAECVALVTGALEAPGVAVPLPALLSLEAPFPFVPRDEAWSVLQRAWVAAGSGARQVVLVGGEAGTGKTRLLSEFARSVHDGGAVVLYGGCSDAPAAPYQPFAEALEHLVRGFGADQLARLAEVHAVELARLAPSLAAIVDAPARGDASDSATERYRLFGAVTSLIDQVAAQRPLLLVLDDLQWAGRPTIQLLDHLIRASPANGVAIVGSYRSTSAEVGDALREALPDLRRHPGVSRVALAGFDRDGIRRFVAGAAGQETDPTLDAVVDVLDAQTGGNAFLLGELWRQLVDTGHLARRAGRWRIARPLHEVASPEGVREVVDARLGRLPDGTRRLLEVAAVIGTQFTADVMSEAVQAEPRTVLEALDPAVRAGLVTETGGGEHRFAHGLVQRSVVDNLSSASKRGMHLDVARALERVRGDRSVSQVAHHLVAAVPLADSDEVVAAARRAAAAAVRAVAYDDAAQHLEAVLGLVGSAPARCELLLELADAHMRAGDVTAAQARCLEAHALAVGCGEPAQVVAAALAHEDANWRAALHGGTSEHLLRQALPLVDDEAIEVRVRAALGRSLALSGRAEEARVLTDAALAAARELDDFAALREAMSAVLFVPWVPATIDHQVAIARELEARARGTGDVWEHAALDKLLYGLITLGELDEVRELAPRHRALALASGQPLFRVLDLQLHSLLAMGDGRLAKAEAMAEEANTLSGFLSGNDAAGGYGVQLFTIRREQGRLGEARPLVEAVARLGREGATWRPALAVLYAELGRTDDAARELRYLVADGLLAVPRDSLYCTSLSYLADAAVAVADHDAGDAVYRELVPYRNLVVQVGNLLAAYGSVDRHLGSLAALLGRPRDAETHFEAALRLDGRAGMPVWLAHSQVAYGGFLAGRGRPGDVDRGRALLQSAVETARRLGMARLLADATDALDRAATAPVTGPGNDSRGDGGPTVSLTAREVAVLHHLVEGRSNREIGSRLHISQHTAANHVRSILLKTGCANRTEAATWAMRRGLVAG
ncbi:MAG TPA: AAA family ATPase [Acidimicrobiales bacterium]|nr:AAA family ATPase [Acidimicrobiales bacterium]